MSEQDDGSSELDATYTDLGIVETRRAIEAILMVATDPTPASLLAQLLEVPVEHVELLCHALADSYEEANHGFQLVKVAGGWRYQTHPDMAPYVERFAMDGQSAKLSNAALETLAIVAYKQPISRAQVSAIRGVNVDAVLRTLVQRGYVDEIGRDTGAGQAVLFGTTSLFLERLGINSPTDLPALGDFVPSAEVVEALEQTLKVNLDPDFVKDPPPDDDTAHRATTTDAPGDEPAPTPEDAVLPAEDVAAPPDGEGVDDEAEQISAEAEPVSEDEPVAEAEPVAEDEPVAEAEPVDDGGPAADLEVADIEADGAEAELAVDEVLPGGEDPAPDPAGPVADGGAVEDTSNEIVSTTIASTEVADEDDAAGTAALEEPASDARPAAEEVVTDAVASPKSWPAPDPHVSPASAPGLVPSPDLDRRPAPPAAPGPVAAPDSTDNDRQRLGPIAARHGGHEPAPGGHGQALDRIGSVVAGPGGTPASPAGLGQGDHVGGSFDAGSGPAITPSGAGWTVDPTSTGHGPIDDPGADGTTDPAADQPSGDRWADSRTATGPSAEDQPAPDPSEHGSQGRPDPGPKPDRDGRPELVIDLDAGSFGPDHGSNIEPGTGAGWPPISGERADTILDPADTGPDDTGPDDTGPDDTGPGDAGSAVVARPSDPGVSPA